MSEFKKSKKKDGSTVYSKNVYLGVDPKTGKKKRTTLTAKTQKELKLKIARKKIEIEENGFVSDDETSQELISFEEVYNLWFSSHKNTVEDTTAERIESLFKNHIIPKFGNSYLQDIEPLDCQKALNDWYSYYTNYSVLKSYTSSIFKYAISLGLIKNKPNPMDLTIKPKSKKKAKIIEDELENFYDLEQLEHFFKILENEASFMDFLIFRVLAFTGLRKGELGALTWNDFNKSDKTLRVNKSLAYANGKYRIKPPKNKPSNRILPLDDKTYNLLLKWRTEQNKKLLALGINSKQSKQSQLIFTQSTPKRGDNVNLGYDYINHMLKVFIDKYKLEKITPHGFRHSHASILFSIPGIDIKDVQMRLGHANPTVTMNVYIHVSKKLKIEAADKFAEIANF